ncbi:MAG: hypothetical protein IJJ99_03655 [Oscillospiraceae bacterium]|nr:hypothetical protein [Oscillospiraceae bacterium]
MGYASNNVNEYYKHRFTQKGMRGKLIAAAILIALGCVLFGLVMTGLISLGGGGVLFILLGTILLVTGILLYFVGYRSRVKQYDAPKAGKALSRVALLIVIAGFLCAFALPVVPAVVKSVRDGSLNQALQSSVRDGELERGASLPEDPKFVLYDMDAKKFHYPQDSGLGKVPYADSVYAAKSPEEANIVIAYSDEGTSKGGYWYDENSGKKVADEFVQAARIYAIRLDDWTLIDSMLVTKALPKGSTSAPAKSLLNKYDIETLCSTGEFPDN